MSLVERTTEWQLFAFMMQKMSFFHRDRVLAFLSSDSFKVMDSFIIMKQFLQTIAVKRLSSPEWCQNLGICHKREIFPAPRWSKILLTNPRVRAALWWRRKGNPSMSETEWIMLDKSNKIYLYKSLYLRSNWGSSTSGKVPGWTVRYIPHGKALRITYLLSRIGIIVMLHTSQKQDLSLINERT